MPIPLILAPILTELAKNGLNILAGAVTAKGKDVIEEKLGVDISKSLQTEDGIYKLRQLELDHEEFLITATQKQAEIDLKGDIIDVDNTKDARSMNARIQESDKASTLAKEAPYYLDFLIVGSTIALAAVLFFNAVPGVNEKLIYMAFGSLLTMCGTILNFHRGTSARSATKDDTIKSLIEVKK